MSPTAVSRTAKAPTREQRRARVAVAALFFTNGALFANLIPRYPAIKVALGLSNAEFGLAVACFPAGALAAGLASGFLIRRFHSSRVAVAGTVLTAVGIMLAGMAPSGVVFAVALCLGGAMDAITDVAQNSHGLRVQKLYGRSILNSFHAVWSAGAVFGGLMGAAAAGLGVPLGLHLAVSGAFFAAIALSCLGLLLAGPEPRAVTGVDVGPGAPGGPVAARRPHRVRTYLILVALVVIAAGSTLVEDAGSTWSSVYLSGSLGAPVALAGMGFVALVGAEFLGRLVGDRLVDRWGPRAVAQAGGVIVSIGMGVALLVPTVPGTIAGFAAAGLGVATLVPAAMHAADSLPGLPAGTGLTVVSWLMRLAFLFSPPIVGAVADATSLRTGLLVVPLAGVMVLAFSPVLARRPAPHVAGTDTTGDTTGDTPEPLDTPSEIK
ncbi:MFS transporter [Arthrobacter sp. ERGS1:01]|uniref:MFS transporter n=1 Tax=Arthrobacter sp. ERGS1:01 TaxID=1704044 RepID=UPI0009E97C9C|nr:MFS transporter [Arthrobacter sp. ERGS1:01]